MKIDKAKDTIRKMINLANDSAATEGEVENAMRFVAQMMAKYQLKPEDIERKDEILDALRDATFVRKEVTLFTKKLSLWESIAGHFITDLVGGVKYYQHKKENGSIVFVFYGVAEDVGLACELFKELCCIVVLKARMSFGGSHRGPGRSYSEGFTQGLRNKLAIENKKEKDLNNASSGTALIVVAQNQIIERKKSLATQFLRNEGINLSSAGPAPVNPCHHMAFHKGFKDGQSHVVNQNRPKKIGN